MTYTDKTEALAAISTALLDEAHAALDADQYHNPTSRFSRERSIGDRLMRVGAGLKCLDTLGRALR